jgi:Ca-activated chloride channel homolog
MELGYQAKTPGVVESGDQVVEVMVHLRAPDAPEADHVKRRNAMNLAFVIDRSGSMNGEPLDEAKRCVTAMAQGLRPDDGVALVTYDDEVDLLQPCESLGDGRAFRRKLGDIYSRGMTNLHGGWLKGASALADTLEEGHLSRVILLSDGQANHGLTDQTEIAAHCAKLAAADVTTSTYGLGRSFNEDLMIAMGRSGNGNHYYGELAEDLMGSFREEFALLENLCARNITLELVPFPGVRYKILNDYTQVAENTYALPDLAFDGEAWCMTEISLSNNFMEQQRDGNTLRLLELVVHYDDRDGIPQVLPKVTVTLPIVSAEEAASLPIDELVVQRLMELEAARYQLLAGEAAQRRDWDEVATLLATARGKAAVNPWVREVIDALERIAARRDEEIFKKEASFLSLNMSRRVTSKSEANYSLSSSEESQPAYLRRKIRRGKSEFRDGA